MLGRRDPQRQLFTAGPQLGTKAVDQLGFYGKLSQQGPQIFADEKFADLYCPDNGRPSVPPSQLCIARLLQFHDRISDAEVVERTRFDLRWKVALDLDPLSIEAAFAKSTFQAFRVRLTLHAREGLVFEESVKAARDAGVLPSRLRVALDSSPVRGRGAVKDTFNLLSDAILEVVKAVGRATETTPKAVADAAGLERHVEASSVKGSAEVDWSDSESVSLFLAGLLEDCERAVRMASDAECATEEVALLRKVIAQDVDQSEPQAPSIRRGVAKDRTLSVHDPEIRHGRKSSGTVYNGHKAHVAVDVNSGIITAVEMTAPGSPDGALVRPLLEQTAQSTGREIEQALGDTAYSSRTAVNQAQEAAVELRTKMPRARQGQFGPDEFEVSDDGQTASCPAGHESSRHAQYPDRGTVHFWSSDLCGSCPLKPACTQAARRTLSVSEDFHDRRERERFARSTAGRQVLRQRIAVEHAIGRLKHLGAGTARYFGRAKTKTQWCWTAAVANLSLIWAQEAAVGA